MELPEDFFKRDVLDHLRGWADQVPAPEARAVLRKAANEIERLRIAADLLWEVERRGLLDGFAMHKDVVRCLATLRDNNNEGGE